MDQKAHPAATDTSIVETTHILGLALNVTCAELEGMGLPAEVVVFALAARSVLLPVAREAEVELVGVTDVNGGVGITLAVLTAERTMVTV